MANSDAAQTRAQEIVVGALRAGPRGPALLEDFATAEAQPLLDKAGVVVDPGIVNLKGGAEAFLPPARTRQREREPKVRMLA